MCSRAGEYSSRVRIPGSELVSGHMPVIVPVFSRGGFERMAEFKIVLSDQKTGRAYKVDVSGGPAGALIGRKIGDEVDAGPLGLPGYRMQIMGGSDRNGTPAKRNLPMSGRRRLLLSGGLGFKPVMEGQRKRKAIRGNEITADFVQINARVTSYGDKALDEYFVKPAAEEKKA